MRNRMTWRGNHYNEDIKPIVCHLSVNRCYFNVSAESLDNGLN